MECMLSHFYQKASCLDFLPFGCNTIDLSPLLSSPNCTYWRLGLQIFNVIQSQGLPPFPCLISSLYSGCTVGGVSTWDLKIFSLHHFVDPFFSVNFHVHFPTDLILWLDGVPDYNLLFLSLLLFGSMKWVITLTLPVSSAVFCSCLCVVLLSHTLHPDSAL